MGDFERCLMCFGNINVVPNVQFNNCEKLYKLCCKYLHYTISNKSKGNNGNECPQDSIDSLELCQNCFNTAGELQDLTDQLEFYQDSVAELTLMFSLAILNRRSHFSPQRENMNKIYPFDASVFPEGYFKRKSNRKEEFVRLIVGDTNAEGERDTFDNELLPPSSLNVPDCNLFSEEEIKCEINPLAVCDDLGTQCPEDDFLGTNPVTATNSKGARINMAPTLKLSRLQFCSDGNNIVPPQPDDKLKSFSSTFSSNVKFEDDSQIVNIEDAMIESVEGCDNQDALISVQDDESVKIRSMTLRMAKKLSRNVTQSNISSQKRGIFPRPDKRSQHNINSLQCSICKHYYSNQSNLSRHFRSYHNKNKRNLAQSGPSVPNQMANERDSTIQSKIHKMKRKESKKSAQYHFQCRMCRKIFNTPSNLTRHMIYVHEKKRPFPCHLCQKGFQFKHHIETHLASVHRLAKPYKCGDCSYVTSNISSFQMHLKNIHPEIGRFKCRECGNGFDAPGSVENHFKLVHFALDFSADCITMSEN